MNKSKKTPSATAETNTSATAPSVPEPSPPSKPTVPPKRPNPAAKPAATATAKPTSMPKRKRDTSSPSSYSSSSSSDEKGLPPKKGRASGTMLKELLQQGSRILRLAAFKVDQLAPADTVASESQKKSETAQEAIEAKIDTVLLKMDTITNRLDRVEQMMKGTATAFALKEQSSMEQTRWRELQIETQGLQAKVDALNLSQLHRDMDELKTSLKEPNTQNVVDEDPQPRAAREPSPEMERILRQMGETERELKEVRDAMLEVNQSIEREREECKGKSGSTRTIDDLKQRRSRLQAREDRVEREMQDLERQLEREEIKRSRKRSLSHSRTREHSEEARRSCDSRSTGRDQDARRGQEKRRCSTRSMDHQHRRPKWSASYNSGRTFSSRPGV
uniref:Shootin-1 n=1 Tax=Haemonchus contortus TaxID=6289 RepID=A0A7I4YVF3_HAECO